MSQSGIKRYENINAESEIQLIIGIEYPAAINAIVNLENNIIQNIDNRESKAIIPEIIILMNNKNNITIQARLIMPEIAMDTAYEAILLSQCYNYSENYDFRNSCP